MRFFSAIYYFLSPNCFVGNLCLQREGTNMTWRASMKLPALLSCRAPLSKRLPGYRYHTTPEPRHFPQPYAPRKLYKILPVALSFRPRHRQATTERRYRVLPFGTSVSPCSEHPNYTASLSVSASSLLSSHLSPRSANVGSC